MNWLVVLQVLLALGIGAICWWLRGVVRDARQAAQRLRRPYDRRRR